MADQTVQVRIGIAEGAVISGAGTLTTTGLGSCVGLVLYDTTLEIAGMVHIMLPTSPNSTPLHPQKYADTGMTWLVQEMLQHGASLTRLRAKYAGGAQMFRNLQTESLRIGDRNVESVRQLLEELRVPVVSHDVGGSFGRTVRFDLPSRMLHIRTARGEERQI
ncbi:chemotaxis protein CheD [Alicyclobacillus dauci]|uniref:Probable chemoreceptor glutamine deamidase CheD n=1 Tax=Alicyclobacillus dauci TaxID=1475485 RepID=A0ABY6YXP0_9BACL|nr:chemotaxis protein CheD [Alicyclobacillus dauci]WAH35382.1 chemotaxis protein CheD [Alicyclobacillus dauci]